MLIEWIIDLLPRTWIHRSCKSLFRILHFGYLYNIPPLSAVFTLCGFSYPWSTADRKQTILLLTQCQKVSSCHTLCPNACVVHLTSSHHGSVLSSHLKKRVSTVQDILRKREHVYITLMMVYCYNCSLLLLVIVNLLLCLIFKLCFIICIEKNRVNVGFGPTCGFRHALGSWGCTPLIRQDCITIQQSVARASQKC